MHRADSYNLLRLPDKLGGEIFQGYGHEARVADGWMLGFAMAWLWVAGGDGERW